MRKGMLKEGMLEQDVLKEPAQGTCSRNVLKEHAQGMCSKKELNMARLAIPTCK
jgi:hypothetical protein